MILIHYIEPHTRAHIDTHASFVCLCGGAERRPPFIQHIFESIKNAFKMLSVVFWLNCKIQIKLIFACLHSTEWKSAY